MDWAWVGAAGPSPLFCNPDALRLLAMPSDSAQDPQSLPDPAPQDGIPVPEDIQVEVEDLGDRRRQVRGCVLIPVERQRVWQVLTDYDHLAEFVPNLVESRFLGSENGRKLVRQVGSQKVLFARFSAAVVLAIEEIFPHQLRFQEIEGDFLLFEGFWELAEWLNQQTLLTYHLQVKPPRRMPVGLVERRICRDLAFNLQAIRERCLSLYSQ
ncbi:cyclase [Synechococcus sp. 63AY4M2]|jgi:ribosome-associated toxin RatA of RatAB toxin-antitoxin module|nr:cyclase [Synechococcus sp. 63AY4M2]PIK91710.1 cyclase [Synechococcus sp. 65AY6Li]PIK95413.1 cyclase [Synechococcus sp. 60AY4M2]PIK97657.1 cyclase [Synechococcus sp. 63AY4M1]PIL01622.1 cyclase [Synechococcus sp. 65AY640]